MKNLNQCRAEIDAIDAQIIDLFERRMHISRDVALYKQANFMEIFNAAREQQALDACANRVREDDFRRPAVAMMKELMRLSREEQQRFLDLRFTNNTVAYNGVPGAFSESAAIGFFGEDANCIHFKTFKEVVEVVANGTARYGVLPVENSSSGTVAGVYDLLSEYACHIVGEQLVRVEHCLLGVPGARVEDIHTVLSHPQGFAQCPAFLAQHPGWTNTPYFNTAIAAQHVAELGDKHTAAIASRLSAKHYGLDILVPDIHSFSGNYTRFYIICASSTPIGVPDKATITFTLRHNRGTLMRALSSFVALGMNLTHIESMPLHQNNWEYRFFVDLTGNVEADHLRVLMNSLEADCENCRLMGTYAAAKED